MKINMTAIFAALLISGGIASAATNDITALLQKGLFEEEANHNLEAAMRQYQAAIDGFDQDRQLAATAVFRLGECYRKLGKTNEADVQYQRVLREFADQTTLAGLSREYLAGKTPAATEVLTIPAAATSAEDEEVRKIREMIRNSPDLINAPTTSGGPTPLQNAVVLGNIAAAELLLANGADVNGAWQGNTVESRKTPLSLAAERGNKGMIELLLAKGANVNAPDRNNDVYTPLHHAVQQGFKTAAEVLLAHKADVNARSRDQLTPLHNAAGRGFNAVAELLLAHGADVNAATKDGYTPLHFAVRDNWPEMVKLLLAGKAEVNFTNSLGETPLFSAQKNDQVEVARLLLDAKADVNHRNKDGYTPLLVATRENQTEIVKLLLHNKADVNAALENGVTALLIAVDNPDVDINLVKCLLDSGADPQAHIKSDGVEWDSGNRVNGRSWGNILPGMFALDLAIRHDRNDEMEALLAAHADANARFVSYRNGSLEYFHTPLLWVLQINRNQAEQFKILLAHGADPDLPDRDGRTPLSLTVSSGKLELVKQLLDHHADPNKADDKGLPPLAHLSQGNPYLPPQGDEAADIKALLLKAGANEDFQRVARIFVAQKGTGTLGLQVFYRGSNAVNHFSLLETLAQAVMSRNPPVAFPDYAHVSINRLKPGGAKEEIAVNLEDILSSADCSKDVPLEWGDVVQIPQMDHLLNEGQQGISGAYCDVLIKCLQRHVQIIVKGQSTRLLLLPSLAPDPNAPRPIPIPRLPGALPNPGEPTPAASPPEKTLRTFWLKEVVQQANVLLLSSDLSRVKVTRNGVESHYDLAPPPPARSPASTLPGVPVVPPSYQWSMSARGQYIIDTQSALAGSTDLWLRDGDVIEIPERDPNAPAAK